MNPLNKIIKLKLLNENKGSPCRVEHLRDYKHDDEHDNESEWVI